MTPIGAERPKILLESSFTSITLAPKAQVLEDKTCRLTVREVISDRHQGSFMPVGSTPTVFGFKKPAYWLRFDIENATAKPIPWYLEIPGTDYDSIDVYEVVNGSIVDARTAGDRYPFSSRSVSYRTFLFRFEQGEASLSTYYVRIQTRSSLSLDIFAWSPDGLRDMMNRDLLAKGLYYGAMIITLLFNLFFFISMRDRNYLYYLFFLASFILYQMTEDGFAFQYLWPGSVWWTNSCLPFFIFLCIVFLILFTRLFLNLRVRFPRYDRVMLFMLFFCAAHLPFSFLIGYGYAIRIAVVCAMATSAMSLVAAVMTHIQGYRPARYYMVSWYLFFLSVIIYSLHAFSILPMDSLMETAPQAGSLVVIILMSLALGDRVNYLRKNLERFNADLECVVNERTNKLNQVIHTLEVRDRILQLELDQAGTIQRGILPPTPVYSEGIRIDAYYRAMGKVGGDFYDVFSMHGGHLGVLIADVSGHGMPAAFITALAKISFSETIQSNIFPADIFTTVNTELVEAIKTDDFVTAFLLVISPTFEVFYCNASHQRPLLLRRESGDMAAWDTNGLFLGAMMASNDMYEDGQDQLEYGDRILLYTDGVVDSVNVAGEKFGEERLRDMFRDVSSLGFAEAMKEMVRRWEEFLGGTEPVDDVTLVIVEIDPLYREVAEHRENGFRHLSAGNYEEAISELEKALEINPADEKSHLYIGECFMNYGNYPGAVEHLETYLKNNDVDANVWYHLAKAYFILGDYVASGRTALKSTQLRTDYIDAHVLYGLSMKNIGNFEDAARAWKRILHIDPGNKVAAKELKSEAG